MSELTFENSSVFVAGGSSGINLGIARAFAERGARVFLISRDPERVAAAVAGLRESGGE
ncbi:SDR family NAD(P)-dependent oxidoreductase, partial [Alloalcanivorax gelatiniphagus]